MTITSHADEAFILRTVDGLIDDGMPAGLGALVAQRLDAGLAWARRGRPEEPDPMRGVRLRIDELAVIRDASPLNHARQRAVTRQLLWAVDAAAEDPSHERYGAVIWAAPRLVHLDQLREELAAAIAEERGLAGEAGALVIAALLNDLLEVDVERATISRLLFGSPGHPGSIVEEQELVVWLRKKVELHRSHADPWDDIDAAATSQELGWAMESLNAATPEMVTRALVNAAMPQPCGAEVLSDGDGDCDF